MLRGLYVGVSTSCTEYLSTGSYIARSVRRCINLLYRVSLDWILHCEVCTSVYQPLVPSISRLDLTLRGLYVGVSTSCTEYLSTGSYIARSVRRCNNLLYRVSLDWILHCEVCTSVYQPLVPSISRLDLTLRGLYVGVSTSCTEYLSTGSYIARSVRRCNNLLYRVSLDWILCPFPDKMTCHFLQFTSLFSISVQYS